MIDGCVQCHRLKNTSTNIMLDNLDQKADNLYTRMLEVAPILIRIAGTALSNKKLSTSGAIASDPKG